MWQQIKIYVKSDETEALEQKLLGAGAISISYLDAKDQPIFAKEPGDMVLWQSMVVLSLFEGSTDLTCLLRDLSSDPSIVNADNLKISMIQDQNWQTKWMDDFEPIKFGNNLWICPSWHSPPDPLATNIILDPGLAFGSGTHITTSLCLRWLDQYATRGCKVIDYGCGSGVLAIAAALLGAETVHAVDHDQQAIIATSANSLRNAVAKDIIKTYLPTAMPKVKADILLANILAQPLIDLAESFSKKLKPEGIIVLSGFLENQLEPITKLYNRWFIMDNPTIEKEWVLLTGTRRI